MQFKKKDIEYMNARFHIVEIFTRTVLVSKTRPVMLINLQTEF